MPIGKINHSLQGKPMNKSRINKIKRLKTPAENPSDREISLAERRGGLEQANM